MTTRLRLLVVARLHERCDGSDCVSAHNRRAMVAIMRQRSRSKTGNHPTDAQPQHPRYRQVSDEESSCDDSDEDDSLQGPSDPDGFAAAASSAKTQPTTTATTSKKKPPTPPPSQATKATSQQPRSTQRPAPPQQAESTKTFSEALAKTFFGDNPKEFFDEYRQLDQEEQTTTKKSTLR